jgi:hypothetical protein
MIPALSGIRLIEENPARTLVSASTYNRLARAVKNMSIEGGEIGVNALGGIHIQVLPSASSPAPTPGGSAYDGPFAISYDASTAIATVLGGFIIAGTTTFSSPDGQVALGSEGYSGNYVYIDITYSGTRLSSSLSTTGDWNFARQQTDSTYRVCLGYVTIGGRVTQYQHGDIYVTGRLV